jgi:hypothetical protein
MPNQSIRNQMITVLGTCMIGILCLFAAYSYTVTRSKLIAAGDSSIAAVNQRLHEELPGTISRFRQQMDTVMNRLGKSLPPAFANFDPEQAMWSLQAELEDPALVAIVALNRRGKVFAGTRRDTPQSLTEIREVPTDLLVNRQAPLTNDGQEVGEVLLFWHPNALTDRLNERLVTAAHDHYIAAVSYDLEQQTLTAGAIPTEETPVSLEIGTGMLHTYLHRPAIDAPLAAEGWRPRAGDPFGKLYWFQSPC